MRIKIPFFLLFLFSTCYSFTQRKLVFSDQGFSFKLKLDSIGSNNWGKPDSTVVSITVTRLKDHKVIQTIIPGENFITKNFSHEMIFEDVNFDGYTDFELFAWEAKRAQAGYLYYLFDPKKQKFYYSKEIAAVLDNAAIDRKNKTLRKLYRINAGDYKLVVYSYIHNKLTLIEQREDKDTEDDNVRIIHQKRINGKMQVIKNVVIDRKTYEKTNDRLMPI